MHEKLSAQKRKSYIEVGELFFWTATINGWKRLLEKDEYKEIVTDSLLYLGEKGLAHVFAFVIMPHHIHLIWQTLGTNGRETVQGSFLKYTAHQFKKRLATESSESLSPYKVERSNKQYEFWQRDSLAVLLYTKEVAFQKLDYIHGNPVAAHWQLVKDPCDYYYSSAAYYETGKKNFPFLKDLREVF